LHDPVSNQKQMYQYRRDVNYDSDEQAPFRDLMPTADHTTNRSVGIGQHR